MHVPISTRDILDAVPGEEGRARCVSGLRWRPSVLDDKLRGRFAGYSMTVDYFEEQRRQMVAAIRAITDHIGA